MKKYNIIYSDYPWFYNNRELIRKDGKTPKFGMGAGNHYSLMKDKDLFELPIEKLAGKDCALCFWATAPLLNTAIKIIEARGFKYVGILFNWIKTNPDGNLWLGTGHYTRVNTELCLLAKKGNINKLVQTRSMNQTVLTVHPRYDKIKRPHSFKPHIFRDKIVDLFGDVPRIELFARKYTPGWDATGMELDGVDIRDFLTGKAESE